MVSIFAYPDSLPSPLPQQPKGSWKVWGICMFLEEIVAVVTSFFVKQKLEAWKKKPKTQHVSN